MERSVFPVNGCCRMADGAPHLVARIADVEHLYAGPRLPEVSVRGDGYTCRCGCRACFCRRGSYDPIRTVGLRLLCW